MPRSAFLRQRCNLRIEAGGQVPVPQDTLGAPVRDPFTIVVANVPCLVRELGGGDDPKNGKATQTRLHTVYFDQSARCYGITTAMQIELIVANGPNRILTVTDTRNFNSRGTLLSVGATEWVV